MRPPQNSQLHRLGGIMLLHIRIRSDKIRLMKNFVNGRVIIVNGDKVIPIKSATGRAGAPALFVEKLFSDLNYYDYRTITSYEIEMPTTAELRSLLAVFFRWKI